LAGRRSTRTLGALCEACRCLKIAHHVDTEDGTRKIMIASVRYLDTCSKIDGRWYFAARDLILDWSETRSLVEVTAA
jgi:hypothetical protein